MRGSRSSHQLDAATIPERMQPVVSLLTSGMHAHGSRIERLEREVDRHEVRLAEERVWGRVPEASAAAAMAERMAKLEERCAGLERRCEHAEGRAEERAHQTSNATSEAAAARSAISSLREQLGAAGSSSVTEADVRRLEGELRSLRERCEAHSRLTSELPALRRDVEEVRSVGAATSSALSQLKAEAREAAPRLAELASRGELERLAAEGRASAESTRRSFEEQSRQLSQLAAEHRRAAEPARSAAQPDGGASSKLIELVDSHTAALRAELLRSLDSKAVASEVATSLDALRREVGALAQAQQAGADASASTASMARKLAAEGAAELAQHELSVRASERRGKEAAERLGELEARLQAGLAERPSVKEVEELVARARPQPHTLCESISSETPNARPAGVRSPPLTWRGGEAAWSRGAPSRGGDTSRPDDEGRLAAAVREKLAERLEAVDDASRAALSKVERRLARMAVQVDEAVTISG